MQRVSEAVLRKSPLNRELSRNMSKAFPKSQKLSVRRAASVTTFALMADGLIANIFAAFLLAPSASCEPWGPCRYTQH